MPAPFTNILGDARDTTGAVQTAYRLYFYRESDDGNTKAVYTTEAATATHDQSTGIAPDSRGQWPPIWLDTDEPYYVQLWDDDRTTGTKLDEFDGYRPTVTVEANNTPSKNLLYNPGFTVAQRGTSFTSATTPANSDDTYLFDRWILLSDGNDVVDVTQETTTIPGVSVAAAKFDIETANKQFAFFQPLPNKDLEGLIGQTLTFSFYARKGGSNATVGTLRAAIITWSSTADSITSDVIGTWAGAGTNPTLASNWTYENTPSDLDLTTSFQRFSVTGAIDTSSAANIGVLIWLDDTDGTVADTVFIGACQLEVGSAATGYAARSYPEELERCQYFYERIDATAAFQPFGPGFADDTTTLETFIHYETKRTAPTMAASGNFSASNPGAGIAITGHAFANIGLDRCADDASVASGLTAGEGGALIANNDTSAYIEADAEL